MTGVKRAWDDFWFRPAAPHDLTAARIILAATALWLIFSRPLLPDIVRWPAAFWRSTSVFVRIRYLIGPLPFAIEMALYALLALTLIAVAAGFHVRWTTSASALLIYHFAPFEDLFATASAPYFRGFTVLVLGLLVIAFARQPASRARHSEEFRWPLALIQLLVGLTYLLSGISKLRLTGLRWITAGTFESIVQGMMIPGSVPPWAHFFVGHPLLEWIGAAAGAAMDFLFIIAVFSRRAARVIVPLTFIAHVIIIPVLGVVFLNTPLLLLFVNWEWVTTKLRRTSNAQIEIGAAVSR